MIVFYGNMVLAFIYSGDEDTETLFGMKLISIQRSLASQVLTMSASAVWTTFRDKEGVYLCYPKAKMRIDSIDPDGNHDLHRVVRPSGASNRGGTSLKADERFSASADEHDKPMELEQFTKVVAFDNDLQAIVNNCHNRWQTNLQPSM